MGVIHRLNDVGEDFAQTTCDGCDAQFTLYWSFHCGPPEYCPFCGGEIKETIDEREDDE